MDIGQTCGGEIVFHAIFDNRIKVIVIFPESPSYELLNDIFTKETHAFLLQDKNIIVINGQTVLEPWFTIDHLRMIEAHEVGHYLADHDPTPDNTRNEIEEKEADYIGHYLLIKSNLSSAIILHRSEYRSRYGNYPEDDTDIMSPLMKRLGLDNIDM